MQPPDGYTVLVAATGQMSIAAAIYPNLTYHPTKSFIPLNMIASFPLVLVVPAEPSGQEREGTGGLGQGASRQVELRHFGAALHHRQRTAQAEDRHAGVAIPFKGTNESNLCVVSEQCLFTISDGPPAIPLVKGGKTRALAVTGSERSPELPDVPSMAEAGYPDVDIHLWSGFFVPAGTPEPIVTKLTAELGKRAGRSGACRRA